MGSICGGALLSENYPPPQRFLRQVFDVDIDDESVSSRAMTLKVMSYNVLADQLASTTYHSHAS